MHSFSLFYQPFVEFAFMRRALVACLALAIGSGPIGTFLIVRRMSLMGDALSHAILPGAAIGFLLGGLSLPAMSAGGVIAGLAVALLAGLVTRFSNLREDASFAAVYLISLAAGVLIVSARGSSVDLLHVLFGTILGVDDTALLLVASIASISLVTMVVIYRPLLVECFDPGFLALVSGRGGLYHTIFLALVVLNLVAGFQALGTLMAIGLMMLPAAAARFWAERIWVLALTSMGIAFVSGFIGLIGSFYFSLSSGPSIILAAGGIYVISVLFGRRDGILVQRLSL
jgi:zinc/manganese transport system permease protein